MMMMMKLHILPCAEKIRKLPTNTVEQKTVPLTTKAVRGVYSKRSMAEKIHQKGKIWV